MAKDYTKLKKIFANDPEALRTLEQQEQAELLRAIASKETKIEALEMIKGEKGDKGDKGDTPTDEELVALIEPLIPEPIPGKDGYTPIKGVDYFDGKPGKDAKVDYDVILSKIPKAKDGKDGSPDTADQIADKLNTLKEKVDASVIKGLPTVTEMIEAIKKGKLLDLRDIKGARLDMNDQRWHGGGISNITGLIEAGTNITITGLGTSTSPYIINSTGSSSPLTTKGDLYTYSTVDTRLPVGANGYILSADSGETTGLKWIPNTSSNAWSILGNAGTTAGTNFIGTTDAVDFVIKTNNTERMRVTSTGNYTFTGSSIIVTGGSQWDWWGDGTTTYATMGAISADSYFRLRSGTGGVTLYSPSHVAIEAGAPLRWYNSGDSNYVAFKAGVLSGNTTWTLPTADGSSGQQLTTDGAGNLSWASAGGSGTVTSFSSGNLSPLFTTSVANATTTPALSFTLSTAANNTFFGNTSGGVAAPSFTSAAALTKTDDTNVTLTLGGTPTRSLINAVSLTLGWTGTLSVARGGTGTGTTFTQGSVIFAGASGVYSQDNTNFFWDDTNDILKLGGGTPTYTLGTNTLFTATKTGNTFITANLQNLSNGTTASTDFIINNDAATDTTNFLDIGISSSLNTDPLYTIAGAGQAYIWNTSNALAVGTAGAYALKLFTGGTLAANLRQNIDANGNFTFTPGIQTSGSPTGFRYTGAAHTTLTASVESSDVNFNFARTVQFATGALATQRFAIFQAPTIAAVGASTITNTATVAITGAPVKGTNATLTNTHALLIQAGAVSTATASYGLTVNAQTGATNNYTAAFLGGSVGIGTTTPGLGTNVDTKLHISGSGTGVTGRTEFRVVNTSSDSAARFTMINSSGGQISIQSSGSTYATGASGAIGTAFGLDLILSTDGDLASGGTKSIFIRTGGYSTTSMAVFTSTGRLGIGTLSPTALLHLGAGTATAHTAPLKFTSGTNLTTAEAGAMEYNGTNLFFTRAGTTRENVLVAVDNAAAPTTTATPVFTDFYGGNTKALGDPNRWISVNILGSVYKIPLYA